MPSLSDPRGFRKTVAGVCMIAAPSLILVSEIIHPKEDSDGAVWFAELAENTGRQYWAHLLAVLTLALVIPAILGLMHILKERRPALGHVGAGIALFGVVSLAAVVGMELAVWQAARAPKTDAAAMAALLDRINESGGFLVLYLFALALPVGIGILGTGLYLAREAPAWQAALIAIPLAVAIVSEIAFAPKAIPLAAVILFLIGSGSLGWRVLTEADEEWERSARPAEPQPASAAT